MLVKPRKLQAIWDILFPSPHISQAPANAVITYVVRPECPFKFSVRAGRVAHATYNVPTRAAASPYPQPERALRSLTQLRLSA